MKSKKRSENERKATRYVTALIVVVALFYVAVAIVATRRDKTQAAKQQTTGMIPPFFASLALAQPLPATLPPERFQVTAVRKAYQAAKTIPGTLAQQPCYCGCQRTGHRSLLHCFTDAHAASCSICIREAIYAQQKQSHGSTPEKIRDGIIRGDWKQINMDTSEAPK